MNGSSRPIPALWGSTSLLTWMGERFVDDPDASPRNLRADFGAPVISISRAGYRNEDALACVEVLANEERAFFVLLERDHEGWRAAKEMTAWRAPKPEAFDADGAEEEPLFAPRPSAIDS